MDEYNGNEDATREHVREILPFGVSEKELGERYGYGHEYYFIFVRYLAVLNLTLGLFGFIGFGAKLDHFNSNDGLQTLFFTSFPQSIRSFWQASSIIQTVIFFLSGLTYYLFVLVVSRKRKITHENAFVVDTIAAEQIAENNKYGFWTRWGFRMIVLVILLGTTSLSIFVTWLLQDTYREKQTTNISSTNVLLVLFISLSGIVFVSICRSLTQLEKHRTESGYKISHVFKIYFYKVAVLFGLNLTTGVRNFCQGGYNSMLLLLLDLFFWNAVELLQPVMQAKVYKWLKITSDLSNEEQKPVFDVAGEMVELFYRQFIVFSAVSIFPSVGILAAVVTVAEYPLDKFKLIKMCQQPKRVNNPMTKFIVILLTLSAVTALFSPYSILNLNRPYYNRELMKMENGAMECLVEKVCYFNQDNC